MRTNTRRSRLLMTTIVSGLAMSFGSQVLAQDAAPQQDEVDDIVVTGSRIPQPNLITTSPVTQVTSEDVNVAGVTRVEDLVNQLPQSFAAQNSTVANGASGTATVSLRNLGSNRTLVLIDGRRMGYGSPNDPAADLNQIPSQLIERVELLTGGASAVYGSDAIGGVVNFILKKNFEGLQLDVQLGAYQHNNDYDGVGNLRAEIERRGATNPAQFQLPDDNVSDGESVEATMLMGVTSEDGRGNITAYLGYRNNNKILQANRDYSGCALGNPVAARPDTFSCAGSGTSFPGLFTDFSGFSLTLDPATGNFVNYNGDVNAYNFGPLNYYQRPDERYTLGAIGRYEVNDKAEVYAQVMFTDYSSVAQIAPSGSFFNTGTINCDNPLLSGQQATAIGCSPADVAAGNDTVLYIGRRNVEGGGRQDTLGYESYRGVVGVRGEFAEGWGYDVTAQYSRVVLSRVYQNDFSVSRLTRALNVVDDGSGNAVCASVLDGSDPGCVPYNVFQIGGVTQEALDYLQIPLVQTGETRQQVITGLVTGDLGQYGWQSPWAGRGVQVAFGGEYRRDYLRTETDASFSSGDGAGQGGPTIGISGSTQVIDGFAEIQIPLAEDRPGVFSASIDAAYRHSQYSGGIETDTYKVGADYAPIEDIRFRGSFSRAVRAANVIELFSAQGFNLFGASADPCGDVSGTSVAQASQAQCAATGVPASAYGTAALRSPANQYNQITGGNPNLEPEESDTYTAGVVFTPTFAPGLLLSVDYFDISIDKLISTVGANNTLALCYQANDPAACGRINRNANGQLWIGDGFVQNLNNNIGGLATSGIDFNANYGFDLAALGMPDMGSVSLSFAGTFLRELEIDTGTGTPNSVYDCVGYFGATCGTPTPEYRHRAQASWSTPWNVGLTGTWRHYGEAELGVLGADGSLNNGGNRIDRYFDSYNYFDIAADWQVRDNLLLRAGVNNVLDSDPPLVAGVASNGNTFPELYDGLGRFAFVRLTANF